jgi:hypothetical protein
MMPNPQIRRTHSRIVTAGLTQRRGEERGELFIHVSLAVLPASPRLCVR